MTKKDYNKLVWDFDRRGLQPVPSELRQFVRPKYLNGYEAAFMYSRIPIVGEGNIANLGCFRGATAALFALGLKQFDFKGSVYTVDLYGSDSEFIGKRGYTGQLNESKRLFDNVNVSDRIVICQGYIHEWAQKLKDKRFKLIFIDGNHNYEWCKKDFEAWHPLLEDNGNLIFHDTHVLDVDRVIKEMSADWELVGSVISVKAFRRI